MNPLVVTNQIFIHAPIESVWDALVNPQKTKIYMFGCETISDWKIGNSLLWEGEHEGNKMVFVKGSILDLQYPNKLVYSVIDPFAKMEDIPQNYLRVTYDLRSIDEHTELTVSQDGFEHAADGQKRYKDVYNDGKGWEPILIEIKKIGRAFKIIRAHKIMNNSLKASELILNPDGSIYHLNLLPEDIAPTIFLVGDQNRVPEVSKHFDFIELKKSNREFIAHTGYIGAKRLTVLSTGIGSDNIDIVLNELDALVNIDFGIREIKAEKQSLQLIRIGTSGSLQRDVEINSILVSEYGLGLDHLLHFYALEHDIVIEKKIKEHLNLPFIDPYLVKASDPLLNLFSKHFRTGITASCPGFYAPQGRMLRGQTVSTQLISKLNTLFIHQQVITNFEMETASIYGMAKVLGHQAISVNCILANRISNQFSANPQAIIHKAIQEVIDVYLNQK